MPTFNYTVDTRPMADEISSVARHVNITTGAIVAMQAAVILAEQKAADHVCKNVNRGFHSLIRSQISQKMAKLQSEVDSHLMQLAQQKNALLGIKTRMQRDYNMISNRYIKLFNGLNANLKQRVFELDKPTIDFAIKEVDKVTNRTKYLTALVPITQLESISLSQKIVASNIKYRGFNVIKSMKGFLLEMNEQKKLTDQILIQDGKYTETATVFIPIVICESSSKGGKNIDVIVSDSELDKAARSTIQNIVFSQMNELTWEEKAVTIPEIKNEFIKCFSNSSKSQRINDMTLKLFQAINFQTI